MQTCYYTKNYTAAVKYPGKKISLFVPTFFIAFFIILIENQPQIVFARMHRVIHRNPPMQHIIIPPPVTNNVIHNTNENNNTNVNNNNVQVDTNNSVTIASPGNQAFIQPAVVQTVPMVVQQVSPPAQLPRTGAPVTSWLALSLLPVGFVFRKWATLQ